MSLRRSLSDWRDEVVVVRRLSFASRSRTWRSLRSRKALWLTIGKYKVTMTDCEECHLRSSVLSFSS